MFLRHFLKVFSDFDINKKKVNNHGLLDQFQTLDILGRDTKHNFLFCSVQKNTILVHTMYVQYDVINAPFYNVIQFMYWILCFERFTNSRFLCCTT